jgi:rubredoxin
MCLICGWIYDEALGDLDHGIAAGTAWAQVPMNWTCPEKTLRWCRSDAESGGTTDADAE